VTCVASDDCHIDGACDPATGACSNPVKADGASCDDGTSCSTGDSCHGGVCGGEVVENCGLVAPPIDQTIASDFAAETEFIYVGTNAVQVGVAANAVDALRVGIIHGRVIDTGGSPLAGVLVAAHGHPEFGTTTTRPDGAYHLAVNGGGIYVVELESTGRLPAQRKVDVPSRDYIQVPDVALAPLDSEATIVDVPNAAMVVAQGSIVTDDDGTRQATLLVPPNTTASMINSDGTTTPMARLTIRATEYTVGENGMKAMPGTLPSASAYTYAVENSVDEAMAAGARSVAFSQTVPQYVENFLGFPVGTAVPSGYYDRERAMWVAQDDGIVVKIVDVVDGIADLDIDGDDIADDSNALASIGVTDMEREQLAVLYLPGQTLWRMPLTHFTPADYNFPTQTPAPPRTRRPTTKARRRLCRTMRGSIIECDNQALGEEHAISGTPFSLHYTTARAAGFTTANEMEISTGGNEMPSTVRRIDVQVEIAGNVTRGSFSPVRNQSVIYEWDGRDGFGRAVQGQRRARVTIGYVYDAVYSEPAEGPRSFGLPSPGNELFLGSTRSTGEFILTQEHVVTLGTWNALAADRMGGFGLSVLHHYDPETKVAHLGSGAAVEAAQSARTVTRIAGNGTYQSSGDGGPAISAGLDWPESTAASAAGDLYFVEGDRIRRIDLRGTITTVAGGGSLTLGAVDGHPGTHAHLVSPHGLSMGMEGSLYFIATMGSYPNSNPVVMRLSREGVLSRAAGRFAVDGSTAVSGPALASDLSRVTSVAVAADGSIYLAETKPDGTTFPFGSGTMATTWIRRVGSDGTVTPYAGLGNGVQPSGDNVPAFNSTIRIASRLTIDASGTIYFPAFVRTHPGSFGYIERIQKITADGILSTVAWGLYDERVCILDVLDGPVAAEPVALETVQPDGTSVPIYDVGGVYDYSNVATFNHARNLTAAPDGTLYFSEGCTAFENVPDEGSVLREKGLIRAIGTDGVLRTVAGNRHSTLDTTQEARVTNAAAWALSPDALAIAKDGIYLVGGNRGDNAMVGGRIHKISESLPGVVESGQEIRIPADSGDEVFVFDHQGRHLRTEDALVGTILYQFNYAGGYLVSVEDSHGLSSAIERDSSGNATAIVGMAGQRTVLHQNNDGYLSSIVDPGSEETMFTYASGGMLKTRSNPIGATNTFHYDDRGRLTSDERPGGGSWLLTRTEVGGRTTVTMTSAEGRTYLSELEQSGEGPAHSGRMRLESGEVVSTKVDAAGGASVHWPNGIVTSTTVAPDPRFGMAAPYAANQTISTPGGRIVKASTVRTVVRDPAGGEVASVTDTSQFNGRTYSQTFDRASRTTTSTSPSGRNTVARQNQHGDMVFFQFGSMAPVSLTYDARGRVVAKTWGTGSSARTSTWEYDGMDRTTSVTDPLLRQTMFSYDATGRLASTSTLAGGTTSFQYDAAGNIDSVQPPGRVASIFTMTAANLTDSYLPPVVGGIAEKTSYEYDRDQNLVAIHRPDGQSITYTRDSAGRATAVAFPKDVSTPEADYLTITYGYDQAGSATSAVTSDGQGISATFDGALRTLETQTGTASGSVGISYDNNFRAVTETVQGSAISFGYDLDGLITQVGALTLSRNANGVIAGATLGSASETVQRNEFNEMTDIEADYGTSPVFSEHVTRDAGGRIETSSETVGGITTTHSYSYDAAGRLWQVMRNGDVVATYGYDANGNRVSAATNAGTTTAVVDDQDRLLNHGSLVFTYTSSGEVRTKTDTTTGAVTRFGYDGFSNLRRVELPDGRTIEYVVDPRGRRIAKKVNGTVVRRWLYGGTSSPVAEVDGSGAVLVRIVRGEYLVMGGETYRIVKDRAGSPRLLLNAASGAVVQRMVYDEWGQVLVDTAPGTQPLGFAGGLYDSDTGLVRFGARDYCPEIGRWMTKDPILFDGGESNVYVYSRNDPVNFADPSGLTTLDLDVKAHTLTVDPEQQGRAPYTIQVQSGWGAGLNEPTMDWASGKGPIPAGNWFVRPKTLQDLDPSKWDYELWGPWRIRIRRQKGTDGKGRTNLYIHSHTKEGTLGCVAASASDPLIIELKNDIKADPDNFVPLKVH
jgi:RHS repeat-associated protein